jgi:predicted phage-related endonuclease
MRKVGLETLEPSPAQEMGNLLEPGVAEYYARHTGSKLRRATTLRHKRYPWLLATPDRFVNGRQKLLQIKCVGHWMAHHWRDDDDGIPDYVRVQVNQEMDVAGVHLCDVAALICGTEPRIYQIEYDHELAEFSRDVVHDFWHCHVLPRIPPAPDGSEKAGDLIRALYPRDVGPMLAPASPAMEAIASALRRTRIDAKASEREQTRLEQEMKHLLGEAEGVRGTDWTVTWRANVKGSRTFLFKGDEERKGKAA